MSGVDSGCQVIILDLGFLSEGLGRSNNWAEVKARWWEAEAVGTALAELEIPSSLAMKTVETRDTETMTAISL